MKVKSLFRMSVSTISYILVFLSSINFSYAQCPTITNANPSICDASGFTFSDLNAFATDNGNGIVWYDAPTGGNASSSSELVYEGVYYAGDATGNCGTRDPITVDFVVDPIGQVINGIYCSDDNATIQTYIDNEVSIFIPVGGSVQIYYDLDLTNPASLTDVLPIGFTNYVIVFTDSSGCEGQIEFGQTAIDTSPENPAPPSPQPFCSDANATVADLDPGTEDSFNWYDNIDVSGNVILPALDPSVALTNGNTYYVRAEGFFCDSETVAVTVSITDPFNPGTPGNLDYCNDNILGSDFNLFDELGGTPATVGTWSGPLTTSNGHLGTVNISSLTTPDVYVFTYTVPENGACPEDTSTVTITIYETFTSGIASAASPAIFCVATLPSTFDLHTLLDGEDLDGQWTQGATSTDPVVTTPIDLTGFTPGTYDFTYTQNVAPNPCPEESTTVQIQVLVDPNAGTAVNATLCENELTTNSPFNLFTTLDGSQDNNAGTWTDVDGNAVTNPIDITTFTVEGSPYTYTYTIDNGTCSDNEAITITIEDAPESGTVNGSVEFCEAASPASYDLFDLLDDEDQTGTWYLGTDNTGTTTTNPVDLSGLTAGTYNYTFDVDAIGSCDDELVTVQVVINPLPTTGTPNNPAPFCENDPALNNTAFDLFSILNAPYDAGGTWTDDNASGALTGDSVNLSELAIGTYNFTYSITDANTCSNSTTVTIVIDDAPESGTVNGSVEFCEAASPASYDLFDLLDDEDQTGTWYLGTDNTGTTTANPVDLSGLTAGTYNYTFDVDAIGSCDDELVTVQVVINPLPTTGTPNNPAPFCENDPALNNTAFDLFSILNAPYDAGGTWTDDNASGALTGDSVNLSELAIGTYNFTYGITDANTCSNSTTVTIVIEDAPESGTVNNPEAFCVAEITAGQTLDLFDFLEGEDQTGVWSDDSASGQLAANTLTIDGLAAGTYMFTFDVNAIGTCDDELVTVSVTINDTSAPTATTPQIFCGAATVADLIATGTSIQWYDDATGGSPLDSATALTDGETYYATQSDATTGCESSGRLEVIANITPEPNAGAEAVTPLVLCNNITADLNTGLDGSQDTGGTWYEGTDNTGTVVASPTTYDFTGFASGDYQFTYVVSAVPCPDDNVTITVTVQEPLSAGTSDGDLTFCSVDTAIDLFDNITGEDAGGLWDFNGNAIASAFDPATGESGTYTYTITNVCGTSSTSFDITVTQAPNAGTDGSFTICAVDVDATNSTLDLLTVLTDTPDATGTFANDDGAAGFSGTELDLTLVAAGTYNFTYTVAAASPCTVDAVSIATVTVNDSAAATVIEANPEFCLSDNPTVADLTASVSGTNITWYEDNTSTTALVATDELVDGEDYYATQNNSNDCESSIRVQVNVTVNDTATPTEIDSNLELCINDTPIIADLTANIAEYDSALNNVVWYDADTDGDVVDSSEALQINATYYAVLVDPVTGCESSVRLEVAPDLTSCGTLTIPDGFSPNDDGVNDTFDVLNLGVLYPNFVMEIYNRHGNIVYKGNASTPSFDGKSNQSRTLGKGDLPVGVYYYIFYYNDSINQPEQGRLYLSR